MFNDNLANGLDEFNLQVTKTFIETGIPLDKLNHPSFKNLFENILKKRLYTRLHLSTTYIPALFEQAIGELRSKVGDHHIYFIVDESPDLMERAVVNVLVGKLDGSYSKPQLLMVKIFEKSVNSTTINQVMMQACARLWPDGIQFDRVQLVLTDAAAYMNKAFSNDSVFPNLIHITCLVHALHRVSETIRTKYNLINELVVEIKRRLAYSKNDKKRFIEMVGCIPPHVVLTRWGTFLNAAKFYNEKFAQVQQWIDGINSGSQGVQRLKELRSNVNLEFQLLSIQNCFFLKDVIKKLETQGLSVIEQLELLEEAKQNLPQFAKEKLNSCLSKNTGFNLFISKFEDSNDYSFKQRVQYAPLVTVDVERSFSQYKYILNDRRTNLSPENIERLNVLMFNRESDPPGQIPVFDL